MLETLRLSITYEDGHEWSAELKKPSIPLDDLTWEWLKGAFVAVGFPAGHVAAFFDEPNDKRIL